MRNSSQQVILYSAANFAVATLSVAVFAFTQMKLLTFIPFFASAAMIIFASLPAALGVLLTYFAFDGMLKILSGYHAIIHVGADVLVAILTMRFLIVLSVSGKLSSLAKVPFALIFLIHAIWVAVEIFNPYGLGLVAGVAAFKVYVSFLTLYFIAYIALNDTKEFAALLGVSVFILLASNVLATLQFAIGAKGLLQLSPNYTKPMNDAFVNAFFRPFGMSSQPGGPAAWCFITSPLLLAYGAMNKSLNRRALAFCLVPLTGYVLFISQVRASMIKALIAVAIAYVLLYLRKPMKLAWGLAVGGGIFFVAQYAISMSDSPLFEVAKERFLALADFNYVTSQRGQGVLESISYIWQNEPFGIGLSRVGAASNVFMKEITANPYFGAEWSFADNLYKAVTVELGIPGSFFYLLFVLLPVGLIFLRLTKSSGVVNNARCLVAGSVGLAVASIFGFWGSEGALYLPECAYFWMFVGAAMKFSAPRYLNEPDQI